MTSHKEGGEKRGYPDFTVCSRWMMARIARIHITKLWVDLHPKLRDLYCDIACRDEVPHQPDQLFARAREALLLGKFWMTDK